MQQPKPTYGNYKGYEYQSTPTSVFVSRHFSRYYQSKRPTTALATSSIDPRLTLLPDPTALFNARRVLDVGCNEGWVTCEIGISGFLVCIFNARLCVTFSAQCFSPQHVTGVDIDPELIRMAWKRRRTVWSSQQPWSGVPEDKPKKQSKKRKRSNAEIDSLPHPLYDYFPLAMEHMFGPIDIPETPASGLRSQPIFPHNIIFRSADWVDQAIPEDKDAYDTVVA